MKWFFRDDDNDGGGGVVTGHEELRVGVVVDVEL